LPSRPSILPASDAHTERIATELRLGVESLQRGDPAAAVAHLLIVVDDETLGAAEDLRDILARATSLLAQALFERGDLELAVARADSALTLCRTLEDEAGAHEVHALLKQIATARDDRVADTRREQSTIRLAQTDVTEIRRLYAAKPRALTDVLLKKCNADFETGDVGAAEDLAREILTRAVLENWLREEVLARLSIARAVPEEADLQLNAAWKRAERVGDHTLVSAVARAAELAEVTLPSMEGPLMGRPTD
jgi:hypothetical protein